MTENVRKMIRSRFGKRWPSVVKGIASAAASETEPRIPLQEPTIRVRQSERRARWLSRRSSVRITTVTVNIHPGGRP